MYQTHHNVLSMQTAALIPTDWLYVRDTVECVTTYRQLLHDQHQDVETALFYASCDYPMTLTFVEVHRTATAVQRPVVYVSAALNYQQPLQQENPLLTQPPDMEMTSHGQQPQPQSQVTLVVEMKFL